MSNRVDVTDLQAVIVKRMEGSQYAMDSSSFYILALKALVLIADTLVDIKYELGRDR